jgi:hypothetical protein
MGVLMIIVMIVIFFLLHHYNADWWWWVLAIGAGIFDFLKYCGEWYDTWTK